MWYQYKIAAAVETQCVSIRPDHSRRVSLQLTVVAKPGIVDGRRATRFVQRPMAHNVDRLRRN